MLLQPELYRIGRIHISLETEDMEHSTKRLDIGSFRAGYASDRESAHTCPRVNITFWKGTCSRVDSELEPRS